MIETVIIAVFFFLCGAYWIARKLIIDRDLDIEISDYIKEDITYMIDYANYIGQSIVTRIRGKS